MLLRRSVYPTIDIASANVQVATAMMNEYTRQSSMGDGETSESVCFGIRTRLSPFGCVTGPNGPKTGPPRELFKRSPLDLHRTSKSPLKFEVAVERWTIPLNFEVPSKRRVCAQSVFDFDHKVKQQMRSTGSGRIFCSQRRKSNRTSTE